MGEAITRGKLAKQFGIHPDTLRYYEGQKLLKKPRRGLNQYRLYQPADVERLRFILTAKKMGFSTDEIRMLITASTQDSVDREELRTLASEKSQALQNQIAQLTWMKSVLDELVKACKNGKAFDPCPILECLKKR